MARGVSIAAAALLIGGCGSSGSSDTADAGDAGDAESGELAETVTTEDRVASEGTSSGDTASTDAAVDTDGDPTEDAPDAGDFCADMMASLVMQTDPDPAATEEELYARAMAELDDLGARAPEAVADDVDALSDLVVQLDAVLQEYGYDVDAVPEEQQQRLATEADGRTQEIQAFCEASSTGSGGDGATADGGTATITIGNDIYLFVLDEGGTCESNWMGGAFRAILTRVDEQGDPVDIPDAPGFTQGVDLILPPPEQADPMITALVDGGWTAGGPEGGSVDAFTIDGTNASGQATFVDPSGTTAEGTFEVSCPN